MDGSSDVCSSDLHGRAPGSDIEVARAATMKPIEEVAAKLGIAEKHLYRYGPSKAKLAFDFTEGLKNRPAGTLILVTAILPTKAGEGKTTTQVGNRKSGVQAKGGKGRGRHG